jgi:hypothetical protein
MDMRKLFGILKLRNAPRRRRKPARPIVESMKTKPALRVSRDGLETADPHAFGDSGQKEH